jgi:hypothetical protein
MVNTGFMRRQNLDATTDVICLSCFRTVVCSQVRAGLLAAEIDHICNPFDNLAFLNSDALQGLLGHEQNTIRSEDYRAD